MFENAVAFYLNEYLGGFVEGIDRQALTVSLLNGDVTLRNSTLRTDALSERFDLPVSVQAGMLKTLTLKVPWNSLGSTPVVVTVDGLYLLVRAVAELHSSDVASAGDSTDYFDAGYQAAKMSRVHRREQKWLKDVEKRAATESSPQESEVVAKKNQGASNTHLSSRVSTHSCSLRSLAHRPGFLSSLIETIVGNLQISIKNIHIRYEDDVTRPGHHFACGFTLQTLDAFTIDPQGERSFVSAEAMDALRKAVQLKRCAVYFDCNLMQETMWSPSADAWRGMGAGEWDAWFRPAIVGDGNYHHVLRPVDGHGKYIRKRNMASLDVRLDSIEISVSRDQYRNYSMLLSEASEYFKRLPFNAFRPTSRPTEDPQSWWLYLFYAHRQQAEVKRTLSWARVLEGVRARAEYVSLYKVALKMEDMRKDSKSSRGISDEMEMLFERDMGVMHELETRLPESVIFTFRRVARMSYRAEKKAAEAEAAAERRANDVSNNSGWLSWLMGTGSAAPEAITHITTKEEQDVIVDALAASTLGQGASDIIGDGGEGGDDASVFGRTLTYAVRVNSVSMNLVDSNDGDWKNDDDCDEDIVSRHSRTLLRGSMNGIGVEFVAYPGENPSSSTRDLKLRIEGSAIESFKGLFTESKALDVHFVKFPLDGLSDASLAVEMAPSFVYYDPEVVSHVVDFFRPPEELVLHDLADLSVAAAAQLARARQVAQEYAVAAWSGKPKLSMRLALSAPKISVPSKTGDVHLALDFGTFVIETDAEGANALSPRERGLYEVIKVSGSQVSARIMGSVVDWEGHYAFQPLLDECSLDMSLHVARYVDAELPALRASPTIPKIRVAVSPTKINHLVRVLQNCMNSFQAQDSKAAFTSVSGEAWLSSAEWTCDCMLLQWGALQSSASWTRQRLVMYASNMYVIEASSNRIVRQWNISSRTLVSRIESGEPRSNSLSESLADADRIVLFHESDEGSVDLRDIVRDTDSLVVKFDTIHDLEICLEEVYGVVHGQQSEAADLTPETTGAAGTPPKFSVGSQPELQIEVIARLTELQILLAGRFGSDESSELEADVVCIRASEGQFRLNYGTEMRIGMSLVSMDVEDLLSNLLGQTDRSGSSHAEGVPPTTQWLAKSIRDASSPPNLADFEIISAGMQSSMDVNLGSLCLYYNRPTIAALFAFGTDTATAFDDQEEGNEQCLQDRFSTLNLQSGALEVIPAPEIVAFCQRKDAVTFALCVALAKLQLCLRYEDCTNLAVALIADLSFSYDIMSDGSSQIHVATPTLEIADARSRVLFDGSTGPPFGNADRNTRVNDGNDSGGDAVVISSGSLAIGYTTDRSRRDLDIVLQKPRVALELGFIIDLAAFFWDGFSYSKSEPLPFESADMLLSGATLCLSEDVWLSPAVRLLADAQPGSTYSVDGCGHTIFLPDATMLYDDIPLIMIGPDCTLELSNVTLVNADALGAFVRLAPGARLDMSPARGVRIENDGRGDFDLNLDRDRHGGQGGDSSNGKGGDGQIQVPDAAEQGQPLNVRVRMIGLDVDLLPRRNQNAGVSSSPMASSQKLISFRMELDSTYSSLANGGQAFKVDVSGLNAAQKTLRPRSLKATTDMDILLPMAISFSYAASVDDIDMNLEISDVTLLVSPGSLALMTHYGEEALAPLLQPGPDSPVCTVSAYRKMASPPDTNGFDETWITFWRPNVPNGYVVAGDMAISGDKAPSFEVIALARNSGLVAHPESFLPVVTNQQLCLWLPVAPEGYVALGLFATNGRGSPPDPAEVGCVARDAVIGVPRGSSIEHWGGFDGVSLVNVDNAFGTFVPQEAGAFDLRFPVGPTTYGLSAQGVIVEEARKGSSLQRAYIEEQLRKRRGQSRSVNSPKTMEFRRVWMDYGAFSGPAGVSIWRPITRPGYGILGDCFMSGPDPPKFVHLLRVESYSSTPGAGASATSAPPVDMEFVWHDGHPRPDSRLTIWKPVAPDGYCSMGNIAHVGMTKPEVPDLCCVAERLVVPAAAPRRPIWRLPKDHLNSPPLSVWQLDDQTRCFFVDHSDKAVPPNKAPVLDMSSLEGREESPGKTVNYVVRSPAIEVTFFDSFGIPMVKADIRNVESGIRGFHQNVVQVYGGLRPGLLAYNSKVGTWEHAIQPFDAIVTGSLNMSKRICSGIEPGLRMAVKSSTEIATTLALSHVSAIVSSYEECAMALDKTNHDPRDGADRESLFGGGARKTSVMINSLGVGVDIKLEDLNTGVTSLVHIGDGQSVAIERTTLDSQEEPVSSGALAAVTSKKLVGRRFISLQGLKSWKLVPEMTRRPGQRDTSSFVRTSVRLDGPDGDTVIIEGRIREHVWHETIRSNIVLNNTTNIPLLMVLSGGDGEERTLGTLAPGSAKPLPLGTQHPGSQLHVTPALYERDILRYGWAAVDVMSLADSASANANANDGGSSSTAHKTPLECLPAVLGSGLAMMFCLRSSAEVVRDALDCKIDIVAPIKIRNHMPVPVSMFVADGGVQFSSSGPSADFPVHLDIVEPGEDLPIYFTGMRGSLRFRMDAGEYKWAESALAGLVGPGQRDAIRLQNDTQRIPSEVVLSRYQTSPQCTYPVIVTLVSPLWILNKTDWMLEVAVVPVVGAGNKGTSVALDPQHAGHEDLYSTVIVTSVDQSAVEPQGTQASPQSMTLSSFPAGNESRAFGLRVRVQRSGWTEPLLLDEEYATKHGFVALSSRPLLLKADSPPHSAVFPAVLRLEMNEYNDSRILHIDAQTMLQNSCRVDLEGFQATIDNDHHRQRLADLARQHQVRVVLPRGGMQLEDQADNKAYSFVQMADNTIQTILKAKAIWAIPADAVPRPLIFLRGTGAPTLCFRSAVDTAYEHVGMWSRPLRLDVLEEGPEYLVLPCIVAGSLKSTLLLRLRVTSRGPGLRLVILETTECLPRYILANKGLDTVMWRQAGWTGATPRRLPGLSAVGVTPMFSTEPDKFEIELFGPDFESYASYVRLFDRTGENESSEEPIELVISSSKACTVRTLFQPPTSLSCTASNGVAGYMSGFTVGVGSAEKTVDITPTVTCRGARVTQTASPSSASWNAMDSLVTIEVPGISLSLVDFKREVALLTLDDVKVEIDSITMPNSAGAHVRVTSRHIQLDNMLPGTLLPVSLSRSIDSRSALPMVDYRRSSYQSKTRAGLHLAYVGFRAPNKLQLAVDERLVWKLVDYIRTLWSMSSSPEAGAMVRSIDAIVRLRLLSVAPTDLSVSFQNNARARPSSFAESSYSMMLDLAAFKGASVTLKGFEFENLHVTQSSLSNRVMERIKHELVGAGFALIRQFGIVGGATRLFGFLGAKVAKFAETPSTSATTPPLDATIGSSLLKGFRGVVGALAAPATKAQQKHDASFAKGRAGVMMLQRKRLPRVVTHQIRDVGPLGAGSVSLLEQLGQGLLWSSWMKSPLTSNLRLEGYEEHAVLPNGLVLLFTTHSLLMIRAEGFAALDGAAELGTVPAEVEAGVVLWRVEWANMAEIKQASGNTLLVFERGTAPREIVCLPGTPQAPQIKMISDRIRNDHAV